MTQVLDALLKEAGISGLTTADPYGLMFGQQREAADSDANHVALLCGRRAGKTWFFLLQAIRAMQRHSGVRIPYIALTRKSAEGIVWKQLEKINEELGLGLQPKIGSLKMVAPNGSEIFLVGANKQTETEKLRGQSFPLVGIDEAASFRPSLLEYLINDVLGAALLDLGGKLVMASTPGPQPAGYFHDVTTGKIPGWSVYRWTALDNPHLPHAAQWLEEKRIQMGWEIDPKSGQCEVPTYRREYMGEWVRDDSALVYALNRKRNVISEMPEDWHPGAPGWASVIGIDYGFVDSTAHVVFAFRDANSSDQTTYCVHASVMDKALPSEVAAFTHELAQKYKPDRMVGDAGGLGKPYVMEARRRFQLPIHNAEKTEKLAHIELMNDDFRRGRIKLVETLCRDYIEEIEILPWDMQTVTLTIGGKMSHEQRKRVDPRYMDHLADAALYANRACVAYWNEAKTNGGAFRRGDGEDGPVEFIRENESRYLQGRREEGKRWFDRWGTGNRWH